MAKKIKELDEKFSYNLDIVERMTLDRTLTPTQVIKLDAGDIAIDHDGDIMYHRLGTSSKVLVVGPLASNRNPELKDRLPLELRLRLLTWSLIGVIFAIALWFWIRPVWRDLETLRQTARDLGDGHFEARSPAARTQLFAPLSDTMNSMAERIRQLLATHRELSCGISHELRTPIARMRFALEMLTETDESEERERLWAMMEADLDELDQLIDTSLTYARFEREAPEPLLQRQVRRMAGDEVDSVRLLGRQLEVTVDTSQLPENLCVDLDRKAMPYALRNLLRNAFKYATKRISVSAELVGEDIRINVDDDGIGIPPEEREHIFSAFTRLDRSRDRSTGGYGLGLAIARRVLELHGGTATADASPRRRPLHAELESPPIGLFGRYKTSQKIKTRYVDATQRQQTAGRPPRMRVMSENKAHQEDDEEMINMNIKQFIEAARQYLFELAPPNPHSSRLPSTRIANGVRRQPASQRIAWRLRRHRRL
jgi:two-component system sensor histidine kinase RstB